MTTRSLAVAPMARQQPAIQRAPTVLVSQKMSSKFYLLTCVTFCAYLSACSMRYCLCNYISKGRTVLWMRSFNFLPYVNGIAAVLTRLAFLLTFIRNEIYLHRWNVSCRANLAVPVNQYIKPSLTYLHFYPFCAIIFSAVH